MPADGEGPHAVPFGSRPESRPIRLRNCTDVIIEDKTFRNLGEDVIAIRLDGCRNVTIRAVDFIDVAQGVFAIDSTNIQVIDSRYQNIRGPHERVGLNRGNFVQLDGVDGALVARNKGRCGDTEDIVSVYQSSNVIVEYNHFEGGDGTPGCLAWSSSSGSGIALGDGGGSKNIARGNILVNPGQVGVFIGGGTGNAIINNVVIGEPRPKSNVGIYVWNQSDGECGGHTVADNWVEWRKEDGGRNPFYDAGNCGEVETRGNQWSHPSLRPADYAVRL